LLSCLPEGPTVGTSETQVTVTQQHAAEGEAKSSDANSVMPLQAASVTEHHHDDAVVTAVMSTSAPPPDPTFEADFMYKGECEGDTPNGSGTIATPLGVYEGDVSGDQLTGTTQLLTRPCCGFCRRPDRF
jgi:hypothetical protein